MSKTIFLDVQVPVYFEVRLGCVFPFYIPALQVGSHNRTAIVKQDATLVCNAFGDQPISIVWRKVGLIMMLCIKKSQSPCTSGEPTDSQQRRKVFHCRSQLLHRPDDQPYYKVENFFASLF